jgi:uncharacterized membrane protein YwaF
MGFFERYFGGHVSLGPLVLYGFNAMHVAANLKTPWGYVCVHPTVRVFGEWWPWYIYVSDDATPCRAKFLLGPGVKGWKREA